MGGAQRHGSMPPSTLASALARRALRPAHSIVAAAGGVHAMTRTGLAVVIACSLLASAPRWNTGASDPKRAKVSLYEVAPGRQLDFLKWLAAREEAAKAAGVPPTQVYAHVDGDRWDYLVIWPLTTPEQDRRLDEQAAVRGLKTGFAAALEFRELLASHTDTIAAGPTTAAALVALAK
jgi:hypothetical protein